MPQDNSQKIGKVMFFMAFVLFLGLLSWYFQNILNTRYNPNQELENIVQGSEVVLQRNYYGHYLSNGTINHQPVTFFLDTGATMVVIPEVMAKRLNLKKGHRTEVMTANGNSVAYHTRIQQLEIGSIQLFNVQALIVKNLEQILLGMSALKQMDFSQRGDVMILHQK